MKLNVRKIRMELSRLDWSLSDLARAMDVSRQHVNQIMVSAEDPGRGFTLKTIDRIARALSLDPKDLII